MLASLYNGNVHVWNYESQTLVKSFEVTDLPGMVQCIQYTASACPQALKQPGISCCNRNQLLKPHILSVQWTLANLKSL